MIDSGIEVVRFGPFRLSPSTRAIERNDQPFELGDRALDILMALIERAGEIVSHRALISSAWRDLVVSPSNLRVHVAALRKALRDGENGARYIENVTGQGYCFVAPVFRGVNAASPLDEGPGIVHSIKADLVAERLVNVVGSNGELAVEEDEPRSVERQPYISIEVEYALHCLLVLTDSMGMPVQLGLRDLAELQGMPLERLDTVFDKLCAAGILVRVDSGRCSLARAAEKISFLDVIVAIDGKRPLFDCKNVRSRCAVFGGNAPRWATKGVCSIHAVMIEAEMSMRAMFARQTLADLASRVATKMPATFVDEISSWLERRSAESRRQRSG